MIYLILAVANNGVIGNDNTLPWPKLKEDMSWFKQCTENNIVIMGNNTFQSLNNKPLPNRRNIVITSSSYDDVETISSNIKENIQELKNNTDKDIYIIGGAKVYEETFDIADGVYLTRINENFIGDTFINLDLILSNMEMISSEKHETIYGYNIDIQQYRRK